MVCSYNCLKNIDNRAVEKTIIYGSLNYACGNMVIASVCSKQFIRLCSKKERCLSKIAEIDPYT